MTAPTLPSATAAPAGEPQPHARPLEPQPLRWSREAYYDLSRAGYSQGKRVLLLDGEIIEMPAQGNWHVVVVGLVYRALSAVFPPDRFWVRMQNPLDLPDGSEPEPDVAIVPGTPHDYTVHPTTALVVVEVADTSLRLDRRKANAYASAGVQDYWIVDITGHQVEVYRQPVPDAGAPFGHRYTSTDSHRPGETINPVAAPQASVAVADLLPKQRVSNPDA